MDSKYIKACLSAYYRFGKQCKWMATECGAYSSDFLAIHNHKLIEIEIKTSKADLNADFKKQKHLIYKTGLSKFIPNYFYFCVPEDLVEYATAKCIDKPYGIMQALDNIRLVRRKWPIHGGKKEEERIIKMLSKRSEKFKVLDITDVGIRRNKYRELHFECLAYLAYQERIRVVKRAKLLHSNRPDRQVQYQILARLSSEMAGLRIDGLRKS